VIKGVKMWRLLLERKKIQLIDGAKQVGISRKSLDDYYLVLRIGYFCGFDFQKNLDKKMGFSSNLH